MADKYLTVLSGVHRLIESLVTSTGAADAGKIVSTNSAGTIDETLLPSGIGPTTVAAPAYEDIAQGKFVNLFNDAGTLKARLADNSNAREAHGFVIAAVTTGNTAQVYALGEVNPHLTSLTAGNSYWLGTVGAVTTAPLSETGNTGKVSQYLGQAVSATEILTVTRWPVLL